jgi:hypothetical protein
MSIYTDGSFELKASDSKLPALKIGPVITLGIPAGLMTLAVLVIVFAQVRTELEMSGTVAIIALAAASTTHAAVIMPAAALGDRVWSTQAIRDCPADWFGRRGRLCVSARSHYVHYRSACHGNLRRRDCRHSLGPARKR